MDDVGRGAQPLEQLVATDAGDLVALLRAVAVVVGLHEAVPFESLQRRVHLADVQRPHLTGAGLELVTQLQPVLGAVAEQREQGMANAHTSYYTQYYTRVNPRLSCGISARVRRRARSTRATLVRVAVADAERLDSAWRDLVMVLRGLLVAGGAIAVLPVAGEPGVAPGRRRGRRASSPTSSATPFVLAAGVGSIALFAPRPVTDRLLRSPPC